MHFSLIPSGFYASSQQTVALLWSIPFHFYTYLYIDLLFLPVGGMFRKKNMTKMNIYWGSYGINIFVFLTPYEYLYLVQKQSYLLIIFFQYVYLSTVQVRALILRQKFRGTIFIQTISAATAQKREQQQQQHQRVSAIKSPNGIFTMSIYTVLSFVHSPLTFSFIVVRRLFQYVRILNIQK